MAPQPIDPANLSVADFQRVAAAARTQGGPDHPEIIQAQYRGPARAVPRFQGPPLTPREEDLEFRYYDALRTLRRLEPRSPESDQIRDPARAPSENTVRRLEQEARDALARNAARAPAGPGEPDPATPLQREDLRREMVREGFMVDQGGYAAHHIIPGGATMSGGRDPARAQEFLRDYRIDLDSALNGVALSRRFHDRLHTKTHYDYVENGLRSAGSREGAIAFLRRLARRLEMEDLKFQKDELMPTWKE